MATGLEETPVMVESDGINELRVRCNYCNEFESWVGNVSLHRLVRWAQEHEHVNDVELAAQAAFRKQHEHWKWNDVPLLPGQVQTGHWAEPTG